MSNSTTPHTAAVNGAHSVTSQNGHIEYSNGQTNGNTPNGYPDALTPAATSGELAPQHRAQLADESAISAEAIEARGYFTQTDRQALKLLGFAPLQCLPPSLVIPLYNWRGEIAGFAQRPDIPRKAKNGKPIKYELPEKSSPILDVAPLTRGQIDDPTKPLLVTEGAKKADSAASHGLCAININGVYGFRGRNAKGGITALADWDNIALNERAVYVVFDSDVATKPEVERALDRLCQLLQSRRAIVKVVYLPNAANGKKQGLDDFFANDGTVADMFALARDLKPVAEKRRQAKEAKNAQTLEKLQANGLPIIETNGRQQNDELQDLARAIESYNTNEPRLFQGASGLVRVAEATNGVPQLRAATRDALQGIAGKAAHWISTTERDGVREVAPSRDLCGIYIAMPEDWRGVPKIDSVATAPFFAANGELCATNGYHHAARAWLSLPDNFQLPDTTPTPENVEYSKRLILETILGEVSFADDASRAHAVAQIILPFVRRLIDGQTPLHLWDAPLRGSGKSYAAESCILPFTEPTPTPEKTSEEEWRKSLLCDLVTGSSHVFIDNIKGALNSQSLDMAITSGFIRDRLTGTGEMVTASTRCVWVATANNATLTEDASTRSLWIRLDPNSENPEARDFHNDPKTFIRKNRAQVCAAILTLVQAWQEAGSPSYSGAYRCRFPQWQNVIGGILQTVGIGGFLENIEAQRESIGGTSGDDWRDFVGLWHEAHSEKYVTAKELLPLAEKCSGIAATLGKEEGAQRARKLMSFVRGRRDRIFGGLKITSGPKIERNSSYRLVSKIHTPHTLHTVSVNARNYTNAVINDAKISIASEKMDVSRIYTQSVQSVRSVQNEPDDRAIFGDEEECLV